MTEAVSTSETSVNFYKTTSRNIPEDSHLHVHRFENLKSLNVLIACVALLSVADVLSTNLNW
jgi:hypothetical protein